MIVFGAVETWLQVMEYPWEMDKFKCLALANENIERGGEDNLVHAALDLRRCIEALTYEKLKAFARIASPEVLKTWQPPQAIKKLLEFDQYSDHSFSISVGLEDDPGIPAKEMKLIGSHKSLSASWLQANYNALGNYLHYPRTNKEKNRDWESVAQKLKEISETLGKAVQSTIVGAWMGEVHEMKCLVCEKKFSISKRHAVITGKVTCLFKPCGAEYTYTEEDGKPYCTLMISRFPCLNDVCNHPIEVPDKSLVVGHEFSCPVCQTPHCIISQNWTYGIPQTRT